MKNKKEAIGEINKLRKIIALKSSTETQKQSAWCSLLTLQWVYSKQNIVTPANICRPDLQKWNFK